MGSLGQKDSCVHFRMNRVLLTVCPKALQDSHQSLPSNSLSATRVVSWTQKIEDAFRVLHESFCNYVILNVPCVSDVFLFCTDAFGAGLGACPRIVREGQELPVVRK